MNYQEDLQTYAQVASLASFITLCTLGSLVYMGYNFEKYKYNLLIFVIITILIFILMIQKVIRIKPDVISYLYYINLPSLILIILLIFFPLKDINLFRKNASKVNNASKGIPNALKSNNANK